MKKIQTRVLAATSAVGAVAIGLATLGAGGAEAGALPGGHTDQKLADGTPVHVKLYDERVAVQGSNVAGIPTSREAWVSGKVKVTVGGKATGGSINGGYVVGCQVNLSDGVSNDSSVTGEADSDGNVSPSADLGTTLTLGPGKASYVPIIDTTSGSNTADSDYQVNDYTFKGNSGGVAYSQEPFRLNGCGGYASARARFTVKVDTDAVSAQVTVWGKPFSLG